MLRQRLASVTLVLIRIGISLWFLFVVYAALLQVRPGFMYIGIAILLGYGIVTLRNTIYALLRPKREVTTFEGVLAIGVVGVLLYVSLEYGVDESSLLSSGLTIAILALNWFTLKALYAQSTEQGAAADAGNRPGAYGG